MTKMMIRSFTVRAAAAVTAAAMVLTGLALDPGGGTLTGLALKPGRGALTAGPTDGKGGRNTERAVTVTPRRAGVLSVSRKSITVREPAVLTVKFSPPGDRYAIRYQVADESVAEAEWDGDWIGNQSDLLIRPKRSGKTLIWITNNYNDETEVIRVTSKVSAEAEKIDDIRRALTERGTYENGDWILTCGGGGTLSCGDGSFDISFSVKEQNQFFSVDGIDGNKTSCLIFRTRTFGRDYIASASPAYLRPGARLPWEPGEGRRAGKSACRASDAAAEAGMRALSRALEDEFGLKMADIGFTGY